MNDIVTFLMLVGIFAVSGFIGIISACLVCYGLTIFSDWLKHFWR
jgi:hypothetical protein